MALACGGGGGSDEGATSSGSDSSSGAASSSESSESASESSTGPAADSSGGTTLAGSESGSSGDGTTGEPGECPSEWPRAWIDGTDCSEPEIQVHRVDTNTYILRQSLCTNFEAPFLYLMFGQDRVLLEDTGAGGIDVADTVFGIVEDWLVETGNTSIELVVVNSHAHGDHVQGNPMFQGFDGVSVVGTGVAAVSNFFGIGEWPTEIVTYDLGGRVLHIVPIPGHEASHIAIYDEATQWLLTGDTLYPGRLYIADFPTYVTSVDRLVDYTRGLPVCNVMGTHIEMTQTPGEDFQLGAPTHPNEHALPLDYAHLLELQQAVHDMGGNPQIEVHDDFIVYPLN